MSLYSRLDSGASMPAFPPAYHDSESLTNLNPTTATTMEQFDIDEDEVYEPLKRDGFFSRALFATKSVVLCYHDRLVTKFARVIDPISEGYSYFSSKYELAITRIGNPLVVKRLLYVLVVVIGMYVITLSESSEGISGLSGDAFSVGRFYDMSKLGAALSSYIKASSLEANLEYLSAMPHVAGTTGDLALAKYVQDYFSNNGIQVTQLNELESFLNYPKAAGTYLKLGDDSFQATLYEGSEDQMQNLAFSPNSPNTNGEIEAPYIYVNYGEEKDLEKIATSGVKVEGAIFLVKYGGTTPEPNKVLAASRLGAKAVVFISPEIKWGGKSHDDMIQRINVGLTRVSPGDVLTPGFSVQDNAVSKLEWEKSSITAKIPTIPISWKDGKALVEMLPTGGHDFGDGWVSGTASKDHTLKLSIQNEERSTHLLWNVYGYIAGREQADRGVIFGAPRDSGCYGASTSASGTAALLELVKAFTSLQRRYDWSPARSIYFMSFDATEYNLAGSAEWVKARQKDLVKEGYAYIDLSDLATGDILSIHSSPLMHGLIKEELQKLELLDEQKANGMGTLLDLYRSQNDGKDSISYNMLENKNYIPLLNMLGMPSVDIGFRGKLVPKTSCLDTFENLQKECPVKVQTQMVDLVARIGLSLSETPIIPFDFVVLADRLLDYVADLEKFAVEQSPGVNLLLNKIRGSIGILKSYANRVNRFRKDRDTFVSGSSALEPAMLSVERRNLNYNMIAFKNLFLVEENGENRPGYKSLLFGASFYGPQSDDKLYDWNTFPFVRDCIIEREGAKAQAELDRIAQSLEAAAQSFLD